MHIDDKTFADIKRNAEKRSANDRFQDQIDARRDWIAVCLCLLAASFFAAACFVALLHPTQV